MDRDRALERAFLRQLNDRLTDLRLRADLRELASADTFRTALEHDGRFRLDDPRVRATCLDAGFGEWIE